MSARLETVATWTAGAIGIGWVLTAASLAFGGGHPPTFFVGSARLLGCNLLFLLTAVGLWLWVLWEASRR